MQRKADFRFTEIVMSKSDSVSSSMIRISAMPALLIRFVSIVLTIAAYGSALGDVGGQGDGSAADGCHLGGNGVGLGRTVAVVDGDVRPAFDQGSNNGGSDAPGSAGDEGDAACQGNGHEGIFAFRLDNE